MEVTFVELPEFTRLAKAANLTDRDRRTLEAALCADPRVGELIAGTRGIRKVQFALERTGKRGGGRAIYYRRQKRPAIPDRRLQEVGQRGYLPRRQAPPR